MRGELVNAAVNCKSACAISVILKVDGKCDAQCADEQCHVAYKLIGSQIPVNHEDYLLSVDPCGCSCGYTHCGVLR